MTGRQIRDNHASKMLSSTRDLSYLPLPSTADWLPARITIQYMQCTYRHLQNSQANSHQLRLWIRGTGRNTSKLTLLLLFRGKGSDMIGQNKAWGNGLVLCLQLQAAQLSWAKNDQVSGKCFVSICNKTAFIIRSAFLLHTEVDGSEGWKGGWELQK